MGSLLMELVPSPCSMKVQGLNSGCDDLGFFLVAPTSSYSPNHIFESTCQSEQKWQFADPERGWWPVPGLPQPTTTRSDPSLSWRVWLTVILLQLPKPLQLFCSITLNGEIKTPSLNDSSTQRRSAEEKTAGCSRQPSHVRTAFSSTAFIWWQQHFHKHFRSRTWRVDELFTIWK